MVTKNVKDPSANYAKRIISGSLGEISAHIDEESVYLLENIIMESFRQGVNWANLQPKCECGGALIEVDKEFGSYHPDNEIVYVERVGECTLCGEFNPVYYE